MYFQYCQPVLWESSGNACSLVAGTVPSNRGFLVIEASISTGQLEMLISMSLGAFF